MATYVNHIVEQVQNNLEFLVTQGAMSREDANIAIARLPTSNSQVQTVPIRVTPTPPAPRVVPAPPTPQTTSVVRAKATWSYNENGQDPNDLSFKTGDIIEIVEETNADWWTGRLNGKEGLFPSNHVEKLSDAVSQSTNRRVLAPPPSSLYQSESKTPYRAFGAAHHGSDKPPPPGSSAVNSVGLQEAAGQDKKKNKYGKYGDTMAHSAAGGLGFGAGAAIGGGLVRAIF